MVWELSSQTTLNVPDSQGIWNPYLTLAQVIGLALQLYFIALYTNLTTHRTTDPISYKTIHGSLTLAIHAPAVDACVRIRHAYALQLCGGITTGCGNPLPPLCWTGQHYLVTQ